MLKENSAVYSRRSKSKIPVIVACICVVLMAGIILWPGFLVMGLEQAASDGDAKQIKLFVALGADPNAPGEELKPLNLAVDDDHISAVQLLLDRGANIDGEDVSGATPLICAATHGPAMLQLLIARGADVNAGDDDGMTALMIGAVNGDADIVRPLLSAGAKIDDKDTAGQTALIQAASYAGSDDNEAKRAQTAQLLLKAGANPALQDQSGKTALQLAIENHHPAVAKLLSKKQAQSRS